MSDWYEVFDNEHVQQITRQRVGRLVTLAIGTVCVGLAAGPLVLLAVPSLLLGVVLVAAALCIALGVIAKRLLRLRRVMWCVKLSVHRVVGYDYARRKVELAWPEVERLEVDEEGLLVVGAPRPGHPSSILRIPHLFPDYPRLSHRLVEYAEAHGVPVCIEGRPWQLLHLETLYPFMAAVPAGERSDFRERPDPPLFGDSEPLA